MILDRACYCECWLTIGVAAYAAFTQCQQNKTLLTQTEECSCVILKLVSPAAKCVVAFFVLY